MLALGFNLVTFLIHAHDMARMSAPESETDAGTALTLAQGAAIPLGQQAARYYMFTNAPKEAAWFETTADGGLFIRVVDPSRVTITYENGEPPCRR